MMKKWEEIELERKYEKQDLKRRPLFQRVAAIGVGAFNI